MRGPTPYEAARNATMTMLRRRDRTHLAGVVAAALEHAGRKESAQLLREWRKTRDRTNVQRAAWDLRDYMQVSHAGVTRVNDSMIRDRAERSLLELVVGSADELCVWQSLKRLTFPDGYEFDPKLAQELNRLCEEWSQAQSGLQSR